MIGAILGDIIGSPFEFDRGEKTKEFELFSKYSSFTDDSVMTVAIAEALLYVGKDAAVEEIGRYTTRMMQRWGQKYPDAGYGGRFRYWLTEKNPKPYGSYGNGSAMRVSAVGWLYDSLERTREVARATAAVTHNHPEGIKGAESVASIIYLARIGHSKEEIKAFVTQEFGYDLSRTCDEIRPSYHHVESCQETVPEAITAFLEGESFEDVIRTAVSLGGDCDTLTAIAASMAEAYYGIPAMLYAEAKARLPEDMLHIVNRFEEAVHGKQEDAVPEAIAGNSIIEKCIAHLHENQEITALERVLKSFYLRMKQNGQLILPVEPSEAVFEMFDPEKIRVGDVLTNEEPLRFRLLKVATKDGREWLTAFTSYEEVEKGQSVSTLVQDIGDFLRVVMDTEDVAGVIINPWDNLFLFDKGTIGILFEEEK